MKPYGQKFWTSACDCRIFYTISADFDADTTIFKIVYDSDVQQS